MLINILNTLAITASLGSHLMMPQKNYLPNRDGNRTNWTLTQAWERPQYPQGQIYYNGTPTYTYDISADETTFKMYDGSNYYDQISFSGTYVRGNGYRFTTDVRIVDHWEQGQNTQYGLVGVGDRTLDPVEATLNTDGNQEGTWEEIALPQRLYILELESIGNNVETTITLSDKLYGIQTYFEDYGIYEDELSLSGASIECYVRLVNSTNPSMQQWMDFNSQNDYKYWNNTDSLYDGQTQILMTSAGYTSTMTEMMLQTTPNEDLSATITTPINIAIQKDTVNYYLIYLEPRIVVNKTLPVVQHYTISENQVFPTYVDGIQITDRGSLIVEGQNIVVNATIEVIDVPGVMIYVLGMPFTFISTAFNLTLFPGTPYQINLSMLFLSIIGVLVFIFLMKIILNALGKQ